MTSKCEICKEVDFKYKCPKCGVKYCSLACYKDPKHSHEDVVEPSKQESTIVPSADVEQDTELSKILQDDKIQYLLKQPALQFHLSIIAEIMSDAKLTQEHNKDTRWDIANKKLTNLRSKGVEENELVEEFCLRVLELME